MPKLKLSKSSLQLERTQLSLYQRLLPSLDMKRRQLTIEHEKARGEFERARSATECLEQSIGNELPMLGCEDIDVTGIARLKTCTLTEENVVGVRLPVLQTISVEIAAYSMMARPAWVDILARRLRDAIEQRMRLDVSARRVGVLARALKQITQRVNLFERILIPEARSNIRKIRIFLGDLERDAVVRSKLAKSRGIARAVELRQ